MAETSMLLLLGRFETLDSKILIEDGLRTAAKR